MDQQSGTGSRIDFGQPLDMRQTEDGWEISVALPGVAPEEVAVDVETASCASGAAPRPR